MGLNVHDWLYVTDHCDAISAAIKRGRLGDPYIIGGHNEIKNIDIVHTICQLLDEMQPSEKLNSYTELITFVQDRPGHDLRYAIDASKIQNELSWVPKESFETGIRKTIQWYHDNHDWWKNIQYKTYQRR